MTLNRSSVLHTGSCTKFLTEKIFNHQSTCKTCFWRIAFFPWFLYSYCFCHFYLKLGWIWEELKSECAFLNFIFVKFIFLYLFNQLSIQGLVRGFWSLNLKNIFFLLWRTLCYLRCKTCSINKVWFDILIIPSQVYV